MSKNFKGRGIDLEILGIGRTGHIALMNLIPALILKQDELL